MNLSHIDEDGNARMVDVSQKKISKRVAVAEGYVHMKRETISMIKTGTAKKGNVLTTAKIAGIMAAKKTSELIPLCHNISLDHVDVNFEIIEDHVKITSAVTCSAKTGAEMEALTAVTVAALTIYDMCKAVDRAIVIKDICLLEKRGGKSGAWKREE